MRMRTTLVPAVLLAAAVASAAPWAPPPPAENGWDWIRLNSGEWLGGSLELMRDRDLSFDSDELDLLSLDWADVAELHSPRILTYRFDPGGTVTGTAVMRGDSVAVRTGAGVRTLPRDDLVLIMEGRLREWNYWSAKLAAGLVTRSGNSSQADFNSSVRVQRLTPGTRGLFTYAGNYGKVDGTENVNNHNLSAAFDVLVAAGLFVTPASVNFVRDPFQNLDRKTTVGAGVGYVIARDGDLDWSVGVSGGYQHTRYMSVQPGAEATVENATLVFSTDLEWDATDALDVLLDYSLQMGVPDVSRAYHHAQGTLSLDLLGDDLDLEVGLVWDRVESPQPGEGGVAPERDDFRSTVAVALDL